MNKVIYILTLVVFTSSCGSFKKLPEGAPEGLKEKQLKEKMMAAQNKFDQLQITGNGRFESKDFSQSFKFEIRLLNDSLIWVDLADPILGIKVARAWITKDSVAMTQKINREYFTGKPSELKEQIGLNFGFYELQAILSANLLYGWESDYEQQYIPKHYQLVNTNFEQNRQQMELQLYPSNFKPYQHFVKLPNEGYQFEIKNIDFVEKGEQLFYPKQIEINYRSSEKAFLKLTIKKVQKNNPSIKFPFRIPSSYAPMR